MGSTSRVRLPKSWLFPLVLFACPCTDDSGDGLAQGQRARTRDILNGIFETSDRSVRVTLCQDDDVSVPAPACTQVHVIHVDRENSSARGDGCCDPWNVEYDTGVRVRLESETGAQALEGVAVFTFDGSFNMSTILLSPPVTITADSAETTIVATLSAEGGLDLEIADGNTTDQLELTRLSDAHCL